jgi:hypothetical protein
MGRAADLAWQSIKSATSQTARQTVRAIQRHHGPAGILARTLLMMSIR